MEIPLAESVEEIKLKTALGFNGHVKGGIAATPCGAYVAMPLGAAVVVRSSHTGAQFFCQGHTGSVSCVRISRLGGLMASGQDSEGETKASVVIWDLTRVKAVMRDGVRTDKSVVKLELIQHIGKVQALDFSHDEQWLITLGGRVDNAIIVWSTTTGVAVCASPAAPDTALCLRTFTGRYDRFVTAGHFHFRVWEFEPTQKRIQALDAKMGPLKRIIQCIDVAEMDEIAFGGTTTGEILKFRIDRDPIKDPNVADKLVPVLQCYTKSRLQMGCKSVLALPLAPGQDTGPQVVAGSGDGTVAVYNNALSHVLAKQRVVGGITSLIAAGDASGGYHAGTDQSNWYYVSPKLDRVDLRTTCHYAGITDVVFPQGCSDLFVTSSVNDIRIWNAKLAQEILRIQVPSLKCTSLGVTLKGSLIVSGWSDGKIRAFMPQSGRLAWVIPDAQPDSVTAMTLCYDDETQPPWRFLTGGMDGRIRVWSVYSDYRKMTASLKEHRKEITCIVVSSDNQSFCSSSADGSCIIWDLNRLRRTVAVMACTIFESVAFHPDCSQILTTGSNMKLTYWDCYDGNAIREVVGGYACLRAIDVRPSGQLLACVGADRVLRLWSWDDGLVLAEGRSHSATITRVKISPDQRTIVTTSQDGGIFIWEMPPALQEPVAREAEDRAARSKLPVIDKVARPQTCKLIGAPSPAGSARSIRSAEGSRARAPAAQVASPAGSSGHSARSVRSHSAKR